MKEDMDLIRSILVLTAEQPPGEPVRDFSSLETDLPTVLEHVWLAEQRGLVHATIMKRLDGFGGAVIFRLTPAGHDFLAQAKHPVLWAKAKDAAARAGVGVTVDVMTKLLGQLALAAISSVSR